MRPQPLISRLTPPPPSPAVCRESSPLPRGQSSLNKPLCHLRLSGLLISSTLRKPRSLLSTRGRSACRCSQQRRPHVRCVTFLSPKRSVPPEALPLSGIGSGLGHVPRSCGGRTVFPPFLYSLACYFPVLARGHWRGFDPCPVLLPITRKCAFAWPGGPGRGGHRDSTPPPPRRIMACPRWARGASPTLPSLPCGRSRSRLRAAFPGA